MAITQHSEGAPTIGSTEYSLADESTSLATETDDGVFCVVLDLNALTNTDSFQATLYESAQAGGTKRVVQSWILDGKQGTPVWISPSFVLGNGWDWTLQKLAGTDRAIPFTLWKVA